MAINKNTYFYRYEKIVAMDKRRIQTLEIT